jgi:hypothetical protein
MEPGDHIMVDRGLYQHHGIYIGMNVVHWQGELRAKMGEGDEPVIGVDTLETFCDGGEAIVIEYDESIEVLEPEEVVRRALSRRGETGYNVLGNNCEHFAVFCKTGYHQSPQVQSALDFIAGMVSRLLSRPS